MSPSDLGVFVFGEARGSGGAAVQWEATQWQQSSRPCARVYAICVFTRGFPYALSRSGRPWRVARQWRWWQSTTTQGKQAGSVRAPVALWHAQRAGATPLPEGGTKQVPARVDSMTSQCDLPALPRRLLSMLTRCARLHWSRTVTEVALSKLLRRDNSVSDRANLG